MPQEHAGGGRTGGSTKRRRELALLNGERLQQLNPSRASRAELLIRCRTPKRSKAGPSSFQGPRAACQLPHSRLPFQILSAFVSGLVQARPYSPSHLLNLLPSERINDGRPRPQIKKQPDSRPWARAWQMSYPMRSASVRKLTLSLTKSRQRLHPVWPILPNPGSFLSRFTSQIATKGTGRAFQMGRSDTFSTKCLKCPLPAEVTI